MGSRLRKLDTCWEYSVTLVEEHGRVINTNIGQGHIMTLTYADGHKLIIDELCSEVPVSINIRKSAENSYYIDIDSDNDTTTAFFKITKDGEATTLFTVNEDGSVSLGFGDLVSEQNPDGADAIRIKGTDYIDVVIGGMTGLFAVWNVADNTPVFYVNERGDISITGSVDMNSHKINELTDPALDQDAATKKYVDDADAAYTRHDLATAASDFLVASGAGVFVKKTLAETGAILEADIIHNNVQGLTTGNPHTQYVKHALVTAASDFLVASGSGVVVKKTLAEAKAILLPSYDTGWINRSDWTNVHMGSDATKNADSDVTHGLGAPLSDLLVKVLVSSDGADANSFEVVSASEATTAHLGLTIEGGDNNNITVQTGTNGIMYISSNGSGQAVDIEDWYYKIIVYKLK